MAEIVNVKTTESLNKEKNQNMKIDNETINDSGIEMSEEKVERNLTLKCSWILGQLAWARGSSYPFWPCVVTLDPTTLLYFKVQNKGRSQSLMVHVQYFGDGGRHNWVLSHYMMPFTGLEDFKARAKNITPEIKKKEPKYAASFTPKMGIKKQWGIGVTEASGLMHLSNEDRASIFEPVIPQEKPVQLTNKLKRKLSSKGSKLTNDTPNSTLKKFKNNENGDQSQILLSSIQPVSVEVSNLNVESLSKKIVPTSEKKDVSTSSRRKSTRNQNKNVKETVELPKRQNLRRKAPKMSEEERIRRDEIDFQDYYNLNKEFWKTDYPVATDEDIKKLLKEMWDDMDVEEKSNNLNRNFDDYRYNSTGNSKVKKVQRTTLRQEKENSKNTENAQESKSTLQVNGKSEEPIKNTVESEKNSEPVKTKVSPTKEKNKENDKDNSNVQKEKSKITPVTSDDNVQKEKNKVTSVTNDDNVQKEKSKITPVTSDDNVQKEKNKIASESGDENVQKENKSNSETSGANNLKENNELTSKTNDLENDKKEKNPETKNSLQNGKTEDLKKKSNNAESKVNDKEVSVKETNIENKKKKKLNGDEAVKT